MMKVNVSNFNLRKTYLILEITDMAVRPLSAIKSQQFE